MNKKNHTSMHTYPWIIHTSAYIYIYIQHPYIHTSMKKNHTSHHRKQAGQGSGGARQRAASRADKGGGAGEKRERRAAGAALKEGGCVRLGEGAEEEAGQRTAAMAVRRRARAGLPLRKERSGALGWAWPVGPAQFGGKFLFFNKHIFFQRTKIIKTK